MSSRRRAWCLAAGLAIGACAPGGGGELVTARLACSSGVSCNAYEWTIGLRLGGPSIGGQHIKCRCLEAGDRPAQP